MSRERIVQPEPIAEEASDHPRLTLRPSTLDEYIGQPAVVEKLRIAIEAARQRSEPLEHALFYGPPGLGKTTLAHIIAHEMGGQITATSGPALERPGDLVGILTNLNEGDVLFIDEIHRLPRIVEEFIYPAMEDCKIDFLVEKGAFAKTVNMPLQRFTLVGATTRAGFLSPPFRERFGLFYHLDFYPESELGAIVERSAALLEVALDAQAARVIAARSRGTPRVANRLLRRVRDYAETRATGTVTIEAADAAFELEGVDVAGLDELDRKYLRTIIDFYDGGPVGIEALSATLNEESDTLEDMVEPFLLKLGFLQRTRQGRRATPRAYSHLHLRPGVQDTGDLFD